MGAGVVVLTRQGLTHAAMVAFAAALVTGGCVVHSDAIEERVFYCQTDSQCGEGYHCYTAFYRFLDVEPGFCAPACDSGCVGLSCEGCDGYCTDDGACLRTCDPDNEKSCPGSFDCLRTQLDGQDPAHGPEGVCTPAETCSSSSDCAADELCLADFFDPAVVDIDHTLCTPHRSDCLENPCPNGWYCALANSASIGEAFICLPPCEEGNFCPPGLACYVDISVFPVARICSVNSGAGYRCDDDINCVTTSCNAGTCAVR